MYGRPGIIYGFHGCDRRVAEAVLASHTTHLRSSRNDYDWLGNGIYFWESSPRRGLEFSRAAKVRKCISKGRIRHPYVIGAVIELGNCLNLLDQAGLMEMRTAYCMFERLSRKLGKKLPVNRSKDESGAFLVRSLDCAVFEYLHRLRAESGMAPYDTVLGAVWEGGELYENAGLTDKSHIQVSVRNRDCIRGYFRVRAIDDTDLARWDRHPLAPGRCTGRAR